MTAVYVAASATGETKIGISQNPARRVWAFRATELKFVLECPSHEAAIDIEDAAVERLRHRDHYGEWFSGVPAEEMIATIWDVAGQLGHRGQLAHPILIREALRNGKYRPMSKRTVRKKTHSGRHQDRYRRHDSP